MKRLGTILGVTATLLTLVGSAPGEAATRARFRAETILNDPSVRISAGTTHTCQVNEDGTVRCWGGNASGQLGNGTTTTDPTRVPVLVSGLTTAVAVAAGVSHTCALLTGGSVRCWGSNSDGQIGAGTIGVDNLTPVVVSGVTAAVAIVAGTNHTCALLAGGTVACWGGNDSGQLGIGTSGADRLTPATVITSPSTPLTNVVAITAGSLYTCALQAVGSVRCWGNNVFGQLGTGDMAPSSVPVGVVGLSNAVAITAGGFFHTCALLASGTARCWGANSNGQLGDGTTTNRLTPVTVRDATGSILTIAVAITNKGPHTCALLANGTARCWGANNSGQFGNGTTTSSSTAVAVGTFFNSLTNAVAITGGSGHTCALLADGSAKCWGLNTSGQLGISNTAPSNTAPTAVLGGGGSISARDIAAGRNHTCAVRANGTVACWGSNASGQLGDGTTTTRLVPVPVGNPAGPVVAVAAGDAHTCALEASGQVRCWGDNSSGQLGDGTTANRLIPGLPVAGLVNAVGIAAGGTLGGAHTCALLGDGTVKCWGANGSGQLGTGGTLPSSVPVLVSDLFNVVSIAVGEFHTCALVAVGVPFCWGANGSGRLGTSPTTNPLLPALVSLDNPVAIAGGNTHTCALRADGTAWCWGANLFGQLGIGSTASRSVPTFTNLFNVVAIAGGFGHTCAAVADGTARCWGDNASGQLGNSTAPSSSLTPVTVGRLVGNLFTFFSPLGGVVNLTTGRRHSCALFASGGVACWGENTVGQLGIGSTTNQVSPFTVPSFLLNIDPSVVLTNNDRVSTVTILANCEVDQRLHIDVALTQGEISGHGVEVVNCTGGLGRYPVRVPAHGRDGFIEGPAEVSAEARIVERGSVVDTQEWTRKVQIIVASTRVFPQSESTEREW
jgi:alpha-tubulin suppressor-like RCC1 family protein